VGATGTIVGAGGGFVLVPVLLLLYPDRKPETITSMSLLFVLLSSLSATFAYARQKRIDYRSGAWLAAGTLPGAIGGALLVTAVPRRAFEAGFAAVLIALALFLLLRRAQSGIVQPPTGRGVIRRRLTDAFGNTFVWSMQLWKGLPMAPVIAFVGALLGIGGGVIQVPMMVIVLHFPVHIAVATSQVVVTVMAAQSTATHIAQGTIGFDETLAQALLLAVGALPGAQVGAWLSRQFAGAAITRVLAASVLLVGVRLAYGALTG
jgi:hypothetical protein